MFALILPAAIGFALSMAIAWIVPDRPARSPIPVALQPWLSALAVSPVLTWMALIPGVPIAVSAVRRGRAGWAVAALAGGAIWLALVTVLGGIFYAAWVSALGPGGEGTSILGQVHGVLSFAAVGAVVGLSYWLGLRLAAAPLFLAPASGVGRAS